jgi:hypothetical protein
VIILCSDSDGGAVETVKGTTIDTTGTYTDSCAQAGWVREYVCVNSTHSDFWDILCQPGTTCVNGACK